MMRGELGRIGPIFRFLSENVPNNLNVLRERRSLTNASRKKFDRPARHRSRRPLRPTISSAADLHQRAAVTASGRFARGTAPTRAAAAGLFG
jgi:hypothetical protein